MAGRHAKPIELLLQEGKKHLAKDEIAERKAKENSLKSHIAKYRPSNSVMQSPAAILMFKKLKKLYKDIEYVEALDENIINRYCLLIAQAEDIEFRTTRLNQLVNESENIEKTIEYYKLIAGFEITLYKINDMILKLEDRLFLNPVSRIKNVPKKPKQKEAPSVEERRFANV
jgi:phage terminase small subunit